MSEPRPSGRRLATVPNALSLLRLLAAPGLIALGAADLRIAVVALYLAMAVIDWLDGKLATWLDQRSEIGARLDTVADDLMYGALLIAVWLLEGERLLAEAPYLLAVLSTYALNGVAGWWKFRRWPSYHTRTAKVSWLLVMIGTLVFLSGGSPWPLRLALLVVIWGNLEGVAITALLPEARSDVGSVAEARRIRGRLGGEGDEEGR